VRKWRGAEYRITVINRNHAEKGVARILADGKPVDRIPVFPEGVHWITVEMK
jgi:N,N'-diacetylchitobiose phosphorylase